METQICTATWIASHIAINGQILWIFNQDTGWRSLFLLQIDKIKKYIVKKEIYIVKNIWCILWKYIMILCSGCWPDFLYIDTVVYQRHLHDQYDPPLLYFCNTVLASFSAFTQVSSSSCGLWCLWESLETPLLRQVVKHVPPTAELKPLKKNKNTKTFLFGVRTVFLFGVFFVTY